MVDAAFERRAARAEALAGGSGAAREALLFAARLLREQGRLAQAVQESHRRQPLSGRFAGDAPRVLEAGVELVRFATASGLPGLRTRPTQAELVAYWCGDTGHYLARALLRPYFEVLARVGVAPEPRPRPSGCPFCGGAPWMATRRPSGEADGAVRYLVCALCGKEWPLARVRCAACAEGDPERLPSFSSESHAGARLEACESCRRYVKSIDTGLDGDAIPEVDDLLSLALDLWAQDHGYVRLEPGLAGNLVDDPASP